MKIASIASSHLMQPIVVTTALALVSAFFLTSCTSEVDFRQTTITNGLVYKIKSTDPFSGKVSNIPLSKTPANFWPLRNGILDFGFLGSANCFVSVDNGLLNDGDLTCFINEKKVLATSYKSGKKNGVEKVWSQNNGNLISNISWENGLFNGDWEIMDPTTGKTIEKGTFKKGKQDGLFERFNPQNGKLTNQSNWSNGAQVGNAKIWDKNGDELLSDLNWESGQASGTVKDHKTPEGRYLVDYKLTNGKMTGLVTIRGSSMTDFKSGSYEPVTEKDQRHEIHYKNGMLDGEHKYYAKDHYSLPAYLNLIDHYKDGNLNGLSQTFDKDGNIVSQVNY